MGNNIIFQQKHDHIVHGAIRDFKLWLQALVGDVEQVSRRSNPHAKTTNVRELLTDTVDYYCCVEASWKNENEKDSP